MKKYLFLILIVFITLGTLSVVLAASSTASGSDAKSLQYADKAMAISGELKSFHNQLSNLNLKKVKSAADFNKMVNIAKTRRFLMLQLAKEAPRLFMERALKKAERSALPPIVQSFIESEVALNGKMDVIHIDDFDNPENSRFDYFLRVGKQKFNFYPTKQLYLASDTGVKLQGFQLDNTVVANIGEETFSVVSEPPKPDSVGDQKTLVFLIDFPDSGSRPFTQGEAYDLVFNNQFQAFMKEQSYNQVSFSGYVTDWITLQKTIGIAPDYACSQASLEDAEIKNFINTQGINLGNYGRVVYLLNHPNLYGGCSSVGKSEIIFNDIKYFFSESLVGSLTMFNSNSYNHPFSYTLLDNLLNHEVGHALGVMHANGWDCGDQILYGSACQHREYGNRFDIMGVSEYSLHFNAFYKELLGWINSAKALLIDRAGTYTINPLETSTGYNLAKIQVLNTTTTPFYLEYRKGVGFDSSLNNPELVSNQSGLFVNHIIKPQWQFPFSRLLDMQPTSQYWSEDIKQTVLNTNQKFEDGGTGVTIDSVRDATDSSITFDVALKNPVCVRSQPSLQGVDYLSNLAVGSNGYLNLNFFNPDTQLCGPSEFQFNSVLPPGFVITYIYATSTVSPQDSGRLSINFSPSTAIGTYSISYDLINKNSGLKVSGSIPINVVAPPVISALNPSSGAPWTTIQINGSGFSFSNYNSIYFEINGVSWYYTQTFSSDGKTLAFQIPSYIYTYSCNCYASITLGIYQVQVWSNGAFSNIVNFEVFPPPTLTIMPTSTSTLIGKTVRFTAFYDPDGIGAKSAINVTTSTIWSSASTSIATINSSGVASAVKFGTTTIQALYGGLEGLVSKAKLFVGKEVVWPSSNVQRKFTVNNLCRNTWYTTSNHTFTVPAGSNYVTGEVGDDTAIYLNGIYYKTGEVRVTLNANSQTCSNTQTTGANNRAKCQINFPSPLQASSSALISAAFRVTDSLGTCSSDYVVNYDYNCNGICGILARYPLYPLDSSTTTLAGVILPNSLAQPEQNKTYAISLNQMANILESAKSTLMSILDFLKNR